MKTLFVGAGATGGYFGGRLLEAGRDVTFLVREGRAKILRERGLIIRARGAEPVELRPAVVTAKSMQGTFDLIVVAVKGYALAAAIDDFASAVGPDTIIVPLLNGMRHIDTLIERFGAEHVYGGACKIAATLDADGDVVQMTALAELVYGPLGGRDDSRLEEVTAALSDAGFRSVGSGDIRQEMWEKWMYLASVGAVCVLMRASVGTVNAAPSGPEFTAAVADEAVAVVTAAGFAPRGGPLKFLREGVATSDPITSSMYRDLVKGLPIEGDEILGDFVARADALGVPAPLFSLAYTNVSVYSRGREGAA